MGLNALFVREGKKRNIVLRNRFSYFLTCNAQLRGKKRMEVIFVFRKKLESKPSILYEQKATRMNERVTLLILVQEGGGESCKAEKPTFQLVFCLSRKRPPPLPNQTLHHHMIIWSQKSKIGFLCAKIGHNLRYFFINFTYITMLNNICF